MRSHRRPVRLAVVAAALHLVAGLATAAPAVRRMFVTSATGTGDLSSWGSVSGNQDGIAGANQVCQALAETAGLAPAGEQFRAWISDATTDAWCNAQGLTGKKTGGTACDGAVQPGGGPWVRTDGVLIADSLVQLATGIPILYVPAELDENGDLITTATSFMTGSFNEGTASSANCAGWTLTTGQDQPGNTFSIGSWAHSASLLACSNIQRLACVELGEGLPVRKPSAPGHLVFITAGSGGGDLSSWANAGGETGLAAGDAVCRAEAAAAGLPTPDSFHAWLSDSGHDAACHARGLPGLLATSCDGAAPPPEAPYRRVDGFVLAEDFAGMLDGRLGTPSHRNATGGSVSGNVFTGTLGDGTLSSLGHCSDWSTTAGAMQYGFAFGLFQNWTQSGSAACSSAFHLQCFSTAVAAFWDGFESANFARWSSKVP